MSAVLYLFKQLNDAVSDNHDLGLSRYTNITKALDLHHATVPRSIYISDFAQLILFLFVLTYLFSAGI